MVHLRLHRKFLTLFVVTLLCLVTTTGYADTTVLYRGQTINLRQTLPDVNDLWITPADLTRINGFELKPEGVCLEDICIPVLQNRDSDIVVNRDDRRWFNITGLAKKLQQPYVVDSAHKTWSFSEIPLLRRSFLAEAVAPDFELPDRHGKTKKLSDFRGKKVLLVTWASWCGCRLDVPVWQTLYEELKPKNLEIILVAQDTGGLPAAEPYYSKANVTYTALIDEKHLVSALYNFVNVPSAAWIDEGGIIRRINEGTYAANHGTFGTDDYAPAVRDWVTNGMASQYMWQPEKVAEKIKSRDSNLLRAEAAFQLGAYLFSNGNKADAEMYWREAQKLDPDNINYFRQDLSFTEEGSMGPTFRRKVQELRDQGKDYYAPLELEN